MTNSKYELLHLCACVLFGLARVHFIGRWRHLSHDTKRGKCSTLQEGDNVNVCCLLLWRWDSQEVVRRSLSSSIHQDRTNAFMQPLPKSTCSSYNLTKTCSSLSRCAVMREPSDQLLPAPGVGLRLRAGGRHAVRRRHLLHARDAHLPARVQHLDGRVGELQYN